MDLICGYCNKFGLRFKYFSIFIFCPILFSCNKYDQIRKPEINKKQQHHIDIFKGEVFRSCILYGYHESEEIKYILKTDRSFLSDFPLGLDNYKLIDSIAKNQLSFIISDSIRFNEGYYENLEEYQEMIGNYVLENCLNLYTSSYLDSMAYEKIVNLK